MAEWTAEQLVRRAFDFGLLTQREMNAALNEVPGDSLASEMAAHLTRRELLTNYQIERMLKGERKGYFYGDYKVLYIIGAGTFARVLRAVHRENGRSAAVKVLRKRYGEDLEKTEQFLREGQVGSMLRHPNIVPIFEVHSEKGLHYLVMDFIEGRNLRDLIRVRGKLSPDEALKLSIDVASGLAYAEEKGVHHRDLKLSNVLVTTDMRGRLVDFGLAALDTSLNDAKIIECDNPRTIDYAGLERATGVRKDDARSDVFFAGSIFYHIACGHPALFETKDRSQRLSVERYKNIKTLTDVAPEVPRAFSAVVHRALEFRPEKRIPNCKQLLAELKEAQRKIAAGEGNVDPAEAPAAAEQLSSEGQTITVMIVESNVEMQDMLRNNLKKHAYRVLVISNPERAMARFENELNAADCAVFCAAELGRAAVDAFNQLRRNPTTQNVPAVLMLDQRQDALREMAAFDESHVPLMLPIKVRELRTLIQQLLRNRKK